MSACASTAQLPSSSVSLTSSWNSATSRHLLVAASRHHRQVVGSAVDTDGNEHNYKAEPESPIMIRASTDEVPFPRFCQNDNPHHCSLLLTQRMVNKHPPPATSLDVYEKGPPDCADIKGMVRANDIGV